MLKQTNMSFRDWVAQCVWRTGKIRRETLLFLSVSWSCWVGLSVRSSLLQMKCDLARRATEEQMRSELATSFPQQNLPWEVELESVSLLHVKPSPQNTKGSLAVYPWSVYLLMPVHLFFFLVSITNRRFQCNTYKEETTNEELGSTTHPHAHTHKHRTQRIVDQQHAVRVAVNPCAPAPSSGDLYAAPDRTARIEKAKRSQSCCA